MLITEMAETGEGAVVEDRNEELCFERIKFETPIRLQVEMLNRQSLCI